MAIKKKYFVDSTLVDGELTPKYGASDFNAIVGSLRTTGIFAEIADCLKVTAKSGTEVNIADGIGWVDGCGIEVKNGYTLTLPNINGTYSVIMKLEKVGDVVHDITIDYQTGIVTGDHVLSLVTVSNGVASISTEQDKRHPSVFRGATQLTPTYYSGSITFTGTLAPGAITTKELIFPSHCKKVKGYMGGDVIFEIGSEGINAIYGNSISQSRDSFEKRVNTLTTDGKSSDASFDIDKFFGYRACASNGTVKLNSIVFQTGKLVFTFQSCNSTSAGNTTIGCTVNWEAW